LKVQF